MRRRTLLLPGAFHHGRIRGSSAATTADVRSIDSLDKVLEHLETHEIDVAVTTELPETYLSSGTIKEVEERAEELLRRRWSELWR